MSSAVPSTRDRILAATLTLVERAEGPIAMAAIAKAAGLSRQALYLTFADKADLFVALVRYVDDLRGIAAEVARIRAAPTGVDALLAMVDLQSRTNPGLKPLADAFELLRRQDPAAEQAWQDRLQDRLAGARGVVARLSAEGRLRPGLDPDVAADLVWSLTSLRMWDDLVARQGWTAQAYRERMSDLLLTAIVSP
ncbi:MAG: TetR/AcrR family transcriptional regulator [Caulobacteraceae bacterium]